MSLDDLLTAMHAHEREAHARFETLLAFVEAQMADIDHSHPPLDALRAVFDDPWLAEEADEPGPAQVLIDWAGAHPATANRLDEACWSDCLRELGDASIGVHVQGFTGGLALLLTPFAGALDAAGALAAHGLGGENVFDIRHRAGLLTPKERRQARWHRVLGSAHDDEASFLTDLASDLEELTGLVPGHVHALWSDGVLPDEVKDRLAAHHGFGDPALAERLAASRGRQRRAPHARFCQSVSAIVFAGSDPAAWQRRWERLFWLACPLLEPAALVDAMARTERSVGRLVTDWRAGRLAGLREAGHSLREGASPYEDARAALTAAGADPGAIARALEGERADPDGDGFLQALGWALVAGFGHRARAQDGTWWVRAAVDLAVYRQRRRPGHLIAAARPFVRRLTDDRSLLEGTARALPDTQRLASLWGSFGLAESCLADPALYEIVARADGAMQLPIEPALAEAHPQAWLHHAQRRYDAGAGFDDVGVRTPEAVAWYREILPGLADGHLREEVLRAIGSVLADAELVALIRHEYGSGERYPDHELFEMVGDFEQVATLLDAPTPQIAAQAASRLETLARFRDERRYARPDPERWPRYLELSARHADVFAGLSLYAREGELERWPLLWEHVTERSRRVAIAEALLDCVRERTLMPDAGAVASRLMSDDRAPFVEAADEYDEDGAQALAIGLAMIGGELLDLVPRLCLRHLAQSTWFGDARTALEPGPLNQALEAHPDSFRALEEKAQLKLLPYLSDAGLVAAGPALVELLERSKARTTSASAAAMLAGRSVDAIARAGLLDSASKSLRYTLHRALGLNAAAEVVPLVRERVDDKANDEYVRGLMLDRLEDAGADVTADDPWATMPPRELSERADSVKVPKAVAQTWNAALAALFAELGETVGHMALVAMHSGGGERLPRLARQIVERLPPARRQDLTLEATSIWIAENGTDKVAWLMQLLPLYGDERCVDALTRAVKSWNKSRKAKANQATRWMAKIPGSYAPTQIKTVYESTRYSESIVRTAREALEEVAAREGLELADLLDQLVPDFGMTSQGLELDVGPYRYLARVMPDLSLRVSNPETGKTTKSLPKAKNGEDADLRGVAENRFKALRKGLKPLATSQAKKLGAAVLAAKAWRTDVWRKLYLDHPVLRLLGQGVVWTALDGHGAALVRFRPTEDGTLIDLDDEPVTLDGAAVRITHPVEMPEAALEAWKAHFVDYEIESPIGQWALNLRLPTADEVDGEGHITCRQGFVVPRGSFASLLERYGYAKGGTEDGGRIYTHHWRVGEGLRVELNHSAMSAWFDETEEVAIDHFVVRTTDEEVGGRALHREAIQPALLAAIVQQAEELAGRGRGYDAGWHSL